MPSNEMIPKLNYRHPHDPEHVPDHILSALIGTSIGCWRERFAGSWDLAAGDSD